MTCACLSNSITSPSDKFGTTSSLARASDFISTSFSAACQLRNLSHYISLQLTLLFLGKKKCLLQASNPLDDTLMSLLQGIKVNTHHSKVELCKLLLSTQAFLAPHLSNGGIRKHPSSKISKRIPHFCNPPPPSAEESDHHNVALSPCISWTPPGSWPP